MSFNSLSPNQMVTFTNAQTGGFTLQPGQSSVTSNECVTKANANSKYILNTAFTDGYASNQLIPKEVWVTPQDLITFTANACNDFSMIMTYQGTIAVNWGDGTSTEITNATPQIRTFQKNYGSPFTGIVTISGQINNVIIFRSVQNIGIGMSITAKELGKFTGLTTLDITTGLAVNGLIIDLPRVTNELLFQNNHQSNLSGTTLDLPRVTTRLSLQFLNNVTLTGFAIDLPRAAIIDIISTNSTITNPTNGVLTTIKSRTMIRQFTKLSTADTDRYLNDSALYSTTWVQSREITLSSLGRTSASNAAVTTLNNLGVTINLL